MQESNTVSAPVENSAETSSAPSVENNTTQEAPPVKTSKRERKARNKARAANASKGADSKTSKKRTRRVSRFEVKCKRKGAHVLVATDKKGAESFATGRNVMSRAAKINAVLLETKRPMSVREIQEKLDAIYGANEVRAVANHMRKLLVEKLATLSEGRYSLKSKGAPKSEAPAPVNDAPTSDESK